MFSNIMLNLLSETQLHADNGDGGRGRQKRGCMGFNICLGQKKRDMFKRHREIHFIGTSIHSPKVVIHYNKKNVYGHLLTRNH